ncbi:hypothetical protein Tco_0930589 [Tanacetum coccineum]
MNKDNKSMAQPYLAWKPMNLKGLDETLGLLTENTFEAETFDKHALGTWGDVERLRDDQFRLDPDRTWMKYFIYGYCGSWAYHASAALLWNLTEILDQEIMLMSRCHRNDCKRVANHFPFFATGISLGPVFLLGLSVFAMTAVYASRAAVKSAISCRMASKVMVGVLDVDVLLGGIYIHKIKRTFRGYGMIHEDGDNDANDGDDDEINSSGIKKYQGSNSSDGGNIGDGVKIAGEVIGSGDGNLIEEIWSGIILSLEFSEELKDLLPAEAGK